MAEGFLRSAAGELLEVHSAGSNPAGYVHPTAIAVMAEVGIDISDHTSKHLEQFRNAGVDTVITVCDNANEACPVFPGQAHRHHWSFEDPAKVEGTEAEVLEAFRRIRDEIRKTFEAFAAGYKQGAGQA
jgi:arsenate reductase